MCGMAVNLSIDEMNILATGVACLVNTRQLTKIHPDQYKPDLTKYRILCTDGKHRKIRRRELIKLVEKLAALAGQEFGVDSQDVLRGAGLW